MIFFMVDQIIKYFVVQIVMIYNSGNDSGILVTGNNSGN